MKMFKRTTISILVISLCYVFFLGFWYQSFNKKINQFEVKISAKDMLVDEDRTTKAIFLEKFVEDAAKYASTKDLSDKTIQADLSSNRWRTWDYYLSMYDLKDSTMLVYGANPNEIGTKMGDVKSFMGKPVFDMAVNKVKNDDSKAWFFYYWRNVNSLSPKEEFAYLTRFKDVTDRDVLVDAGFYSSTPFTYVETFHQLGNILDSYKNKISKERFRLLRIAVEVVNTTKDIFFTTYSDENIKNFFLSMDKESFEKAKIKLVYYHGDSVVSSVGMAKDTSKIFELILKPQIRFKGVAEEYAEKERKLVIFMDKEELTKEVALV